MVIIPHNFKILLSFPPYNFKILTTLPKELFWIGNPTSILFFQLEVETMCVCVCVCVCVIFTIAGNIRVLVWHKVTFIGLLMPISSLHFQE